MLLEGVHYAFETTKTLIGFRLKVAIESESDTQCYCVFVEVAKYRTAGELSREICRRFGATDLGSLKIFVGEFEVPSDEPVLVLAGVEFVKIRLTRKSSDGWRLVASEKQQNVSQRSENATKRSKRRHTEEEVYSNRSLAHFIGQLKEKNDDAVQDEHVESENTTRSIAKKSRPVPSLADFYEQLQKEGDDETSTNHVENTNQNNAMEWDPQSDLSGSKLVYDSTSPTYAPGTHVETEEATELAEVRRKRRRRHKKKKENAAVDELDRAQVLPSGREHSRLISGTGKHTYFKDSEEPEDLNSVDVYRKNVVGIREYPQPSRIEKRTHFEDYEEPQDLDPTRAYKINVDGTREYQSSNEESQDLDPTGVYRMKNVLGTCSSTYGTGKLTHTAKDFEEPQDLDPTKTYRRNVNGTQEHPLPNGSAKRTHSTEDFEESQNLDPSNVYAMCLNGTAPRKKSSSSFQSGHKSNLSSRNDFLDSTSVPRNHSETDKQLGTLLMYKDLKTYGRYNVEFVNNQDSDKAQSTSVITKKNSYAAKVKEESGTENDVITNKKQKFCDNSAEIISSDCSMVWQSKIGRDGIYFRSSNTDWQVLTEEAATRNLVRVVKPKENQTIVFQLLFLNHTNEPELSPLILGRILKYDPIEKWVGVEISTLLLDQIFQRDDDGELMLPEGMSVMHNQMYKLYWDVVKNPRLLG